MTRQVQSLSAVVRIGLNELVQVGPSSANREEREEMEIMIAIARNLSNIGSLILLLP
jgi:hypothetical protein